MKLKNILGILILTLAFFINYYYSCNKVLNNFSDVVSSKINGKISSIKQSKKYLILKLKDQNTIRFDFTDNTFFELAEVADRVIKDKYSLIVILKDDSSGSESYHFLNIDSGICQI